MTDVYSALECHRLFLNNNVTAQAKDLMCNYRELENMLLSCLAQDELTDDAFEEIALKLFKHQHRHNTAFRNYCKAIDCSPETLQHWQEIPALPTDSFKSEGFPVVSFPLDEKQHTFLTSGTTTEKKGAHHFPTLTLYETSIRNNWQQLAIPKASCAVFLTPTPHIAPHSSLSHMMGVLEPMIAEDSIWLNPSGCESDPETLKKLAGEGKPLILLGTALSFLCLFDQLDEPVILPSGSRAMETGGYKGSRRQLEKEDLYTMFEKKLGLTENMVINEYSMTELSSQFYTQGIGNPHHSPPWTRIRVIDPLTGLDAGDNNPGYLVIYDLANLHSVMAVQTQDIAVAHNHRSFTLLGRDPSAMPRGCSRTADTHLPPS